MPNTKSSIRRTKKTKNQTLVNKIRKNKYKAAVKKMAGYLNAGKNKEAKDYLPKFYSELMKVAKTGAVKKTTVSRKISKISKKIQKIKK
tara:strand:+ start:1688 stop:1954 length:267 start_codon:yes stop_codon:yes gene_type:complete